MLILVANHLIELMWLSWGTYWLVSSRSASAPKRVQTPTERIAYRLKMVLAASLIAFPALSIGWLHVELFPRSLALYWVAIALVACGLGFSCWARVHLGEYWSGHVTLKPGHRLIQTGPYGIVRHPIYSGILLAFIGTALAVDRVSGVASVAIVLYATLPKIWLEERWLTEEFGEEYERYRKEVKALVPLVA
jgi:protein-S-isoprenylcysteine O-methyltransferase Ste14